MYDWASTSPRVGTPSSSTCVPSPRRLYVRVYALGPYALTRTTYVQPAHAPGSVGWMMISSSPHPRDLQQFVCASQCAQSGSATPAKTAMSGSESSSGVMAMEIGSMSTAGATNE